MSNISKGSPVDGKLTALIVSVIALTVTLYEFVPWSGAEIDPTYYSDVNKWNLVALGLTALQILVAFVVGFTPSPPSIGYVLSSWSNFIMWLFPWMFPQTYTWEQWTLIISALCATPLYIIGFVMSRSIKILDDLNNSNSSGDESAYGDEYNYGDDDCTSDLCINW